MAMPATVPVEAAQRIAIVCSPGTPLLQLRDVLIGEARTRGRKVLVVAPELSGGEVRSLTDLGAEHATFVPDASGLKLFSDWKAVAGLKQILGEWVPHVVVACGSQNMIYGALAAKAVGAGRIVLIVDGLPEHRFTGPLAADEMPAWRYGQALRAADEVVFHNRDDLALLKKLALVPDELSATVVSGGGVDLEHQPVLQLPPLGHGLVFLMIASLDWRRGIKEYCEAAKILRTRAPALRCLLAVLPDEGAKAIDMAELALQANVEYVGLAEDHAELLTEAHVFVYPGCAEGMPRPLLQALAAGRPIVTTNVAGCRETVDERVNGVLVAPRDPEALAEAMESFLRRPDLIPAMARASRGKAERFDSIAAVRRTMLGVAGIE
jgi:glycosyltransferase involved in cell wall biosynthesis